MEIQNDDEGKNSRKVKELMATERILKLNIRQRKKLKMKRNN